MRIDPVQVAANQLQPPADKPKERVAAEISRVDESRFSPGRQSTAPINAQHYEVTVHYDENQVLVTKFIDQRSGEIVQQIPPDQVLNIIPGSTSTGDGIDVTSIVNQILDSERGPVKLLQSQQSQIASETAVLNRLSLNLSALEDKVNNLKNITDGLSRMVATSSQESVFTASALSSATAGSHVVVVSQLATTSSAYSNALANSSTTFATGTLSLQVGS